MRKVKQTQKLNSFTKIVKSPYKYRVIPGLVVLSFLFSFVMGNLSQSLVSASGQIQSRQIEMSNSTASATSVSYAVSFYPTGTTAIGGIVVDFCSNDPIVGDTCTPAAGLNLGGATPTVGAVTGATGTWSAASNASTPFNTLYLTDATPQNTTGSGTLVTFTISGVTNPSALGSFYARIITYDTKTDANLYTSAGQSLVGEVDYGGIALSTVNQITVTSKVQETITFCVYTAAYDAGTCNAATGTNVTLGNTQGVLSTSGPYVDLNTHYDIQTNALHGATIRIYSGSTDGTLYSAGNTIEGTSTSGVYNSGYSNCTGSGATAQCQSNSGQPQFGLCSYAYPSAGTPGNLTIAATYASNSGSTYSGSSSPCYSQTTQSALTGTPGGAGTAQFGYNITNITGTYGDTLATASAGGFAQGDVAYMANINITQVAGIYTVTDTFIATGAY